MVPVTPQCSTHSIIIVVVVII